MTASTQSKADCEAVMNFGLPLIEQLLKRHGEFLPFGAAMRPNGEIICLGAYDGREVPSLAGSFTNMMRSLKDAFIDGARRQEYLATGLFYEVGFTLPSSTERRKSAQSTQAKSSTSAGTARTGSAVTAVKTGHISFSTTPPGISAR